MTNKLIPYLIILFGLVGGYLYAGSLDPTASIPPVPANISTSTLKKFKNMRVNYSILENEQYQELRIFGTYPVPTSAPGKTNPFQ